jgi:hypothetical protein
MKHKNKRTIKSKKGIFWAITSSTIKNTGKRNNSNKWKNLPEEQQISDMVATTVSDKGQSSQRGRGRGSSSGQP